MTFTRGTVPAVVLLAALALAGCGDEPDDDQSVTTTTAPTVNMPSALAAAGIPPTPDPKAWAAYISALKDIDPAIVGDKDEKAIINRGRDQCSSVKEWPDDQAKLIDLTNKRFTAPGHSDGFGEEKAKAILAVVRQYICPA